MPRSSGRIGDPRKKDVFFAENDISAASSAAYVEGRQSHTVRQNAKRKCEDEPHRTEGKLHPIDPKRGKRNRCCMCNSGYHLLPRFPWRPARSTSVSSPSTSGGPHRRPPFSSISFEGRFSVDLDTAQNNKVDASSGGCFSVSANPSDGFVSPLEGSDVVLDAGATANLACFKRLRRHNSTLVQHG